MRYQVFESNKPAEGRFHGIEEKYGWNNSVFNTFDEAKCYMFNWANVEGMDHYKVLPNIPISLMGVLMEIREINKEN